MIPMMLMRRCMYISLILFSEEEEDDGGNAEEIDDDDDSEDGKRPEPRLITVDLPSLREAPRSIGEI